MNAIHGFLGVEIKKKFKSKIMLVFRNVKKRSKLLILLCLLTLNTFRVNVTFLTFLTQRRVSYRTKF